MRARTSETRISQTRDACASAPARFGKAVLPPILSGFSELYPKMSFEISLLDGLVIRTN